MIIDTLKYMNGAFKLFDLSSTSVEEKRQWNDAAQNFL